jgi:hypothetical protein
MSCTLSDDYYRLSKNAAFAIVGIDIGARVNTETEHHVTSRFGIAFLFAFACTILPADGQEVPSQDPRAPRTFATMRDLLAQVHSIVEGTVGDIRFDHEDCEGPRTIIYLRDVATLLGGRHEGNLELRTFGGPLPNGNYVSASELPRYVLGGRYILFLRNTDWRFSPVIGNLAFRHEVIVSGVSERGIEISTPRLTHPAGRRVTGVVRSKEEVPRQDLADDNQAGQATICDNTGNRELCRTDPDEESVRRERDALLASQRFARPAVLERIGPEQVSRAISRDELVSDIRRFAERYRVELGGYYAARPRIGCWGVTPTEKPR